MIYTKKANFPYPVLMNFTDDYLLWTLRGK